MVEILAWPIRAMELCILGLRRAGLVHDIGTIGTNAPDIPTPRILSVTSSMLEESAHSVLSRLYTIGGLDPGVWRERGRTFLKGTREMLDSVPIGGGGDIQTFQD